jgi:hypothetical protein
MLSVLILWIIERRAHMCEPNDIYSLNRDKARLAAW